SSWQARNGRSHRACYHLVSRKARDRVRGVEANAPCHPGHWLSSQEWLLDDSRNYGTVKNS
ncbi:MAG: hypothetical protein VW349_09060, partial [Gammaproteobacteria bacterium]